VKILIVFAKKIQSHLRRRLMISGVIGAVMLSHSIDFGHLEKPLPFGVMT
jgi:hypothetical protein